MMKPWEEAWTYEEGGPVGVHSTDIGYEATNGRRRLMAASPAMARLLLKLAENDMIADAHSVCSQCGYWTKGVDAIGHALDCELVAVLRGAGVLP